jgi:putative ABC transport system substrate-binding protein
MTRAAARKLARLLCALGYTIIASAARHRLPAVYPYRHFVAAGGLIAYGPDLLSQYRRAAGYVDRPEGGASR